MPVRLGAPEVHGGLGANVADPRFSTGVGLVLHAVQEEEAGAVTHAPSKKSGARAPFDLTKWFSELFYS